MGLATADHVVPLDDSASVWAGPLDCADPTATQVVGPGQATPASRRVSAGGFGLPTSAQFPFVSPASTRVRAVPSVSDA